MIRVAMIILIWIYQHNQNHNIIMMIRTLHWLESECTKSAEVRTRKVRAHRAPRHGNLFDLLDHTIDLDILMAISMSFLVLLRI